MMIDYDRSPIVHSKGEGGTPLCHQRGVNLNVTIHPCEITCSSCKRKDKEQRAAMKSVEKGGK